MKYPYFFHIDYLNNEILLPVIFLIEYIDTKIINKNNDKYTIVIDQFKYKGNNEHNTQLIQRIKETVEKKKGFSLIVCSSLNYKKKKKNLISQLLKREKEKIFNFDYHSELCNLAKSENNEYLALLGYLPRYRQIKNLINLKYINFMKKTIKQKFHKFYEDKSRKTNYDILENEINEKLKWIQKKRKKRLLLNEMEEFLKDNPIKYFKLDINNLIFDYLFPLIETIIDEIIKSNELKYSYKGLLNESQKGWYFKHLFFDKIRNINIFRNIYIEKTVLIKTIFKKEKIENFNNETNTLFYFSYSNVKRYDAVIYDAEKKEAFLLKTSIHKTKKKLSEYNDENLEEDIRKIENKFFKVNKIKPKKYYLIFVLDYDNYYGNPDFMKELQKFGYNYSFYDINNENYIYDEDKKLKEIGYKPYELKDEEDIKDFIFTKNNYFKIIGDEEVKYKPGYYNTEKGMTLLNFLEETCDEYRDLINKILENKKYYSNYELEGFEMNYFYIKNFDKLKYKTKERIVVALSEEFLLFGKSILTDDEYFIEYNWEKWECQNLDNFINKELDENEKKAVESKQGFFIFENTQKF